MCTRYFKVICKRAGIGTHWIPRELRHTFVSVLSDSGVDIEHIADAVGHVNSTITKTVYRHQIADKVTVAPRPRWMRFSARRAGRENPLRLPG